MAPLTKALQVSFHSRSDDGTFCYDCELDRTWAVGAVPQGGYSLGVVVEACIQYQSTTSHVDPVHVTAHFLRSTSIGIGQVQVKPLKSGKTLTNILAEFVQQGTARITAHLIFGDLSPSRAGNGEKLLAPPSPYARRVPLYSHPSVASYDAVKPRSMTKMDIRLSSDTILLNRNDPNSVTRTTSESVAGGGTNWGAWFELSHGDDRLTTSSIPFLCDSIVNLPYLLPESEPGSHRKSWSPTVIMTVEFKARIPPSGIYSTRTVGLYSESRFMSDPEGRHNERVEVWTAPSEIGQGGITKGWRDDQYCIAVADQMALMLPIEVNIQRGNKDGAKL